VQRLSFVIPGTPVRYTSDATETVLDGRVTETQVHFGVEGELAICVETAPGEPLRALPATTWVAVEGDDDFDVKPPTLSLWHLDRGDDVVERREMLACIVAAGNETEARGIAADHAQGEGVNVWFGRENLVIVKQLSGSVTAAVTAPGLVLPSIVTAD